MPILLDGHAAKHDAGRERLEGRQGHHTAPQLLFRHQNVWPNSGA